MENFLKKKDSNRELDELECNIKKIKSDTHLSENEVEKFCKEDITKDYREKDDDSSIPRKKEKVNINIIYSYLFLIELNSYKYFTYY